jgi:geranylgeranyl diphosphate synthase type II
MDDDDLRRGKPTSHIIYGEALAILTGDALLNHAFEIMAERVYKARSKRYARGMLTIIKAAGTGGMIAGQVKDIEWEHKKADENTLINIQAKKTGALFTACLEAGAILGNGRPGEIKKYRKLGECIGQAFQIKDDILDITSTEQVLGKRAGRDEARQKNTYVSVFGMENAEADYKRLSNEAGRLLKTIPQKTQALNKLIQEIGARKS